MIRKLFLYIITSLLGVLLSNSVAQPNASQAEAFGDQLVIGQVGEKPKHLNPFNISNIAEKQICRLLFGDGLLQRPDRFGQTSALVSRYILSNPAGTTGKEWTYALRRNITFHDGYPLRNNDVKFTFEILGKWGGQILNRQLDFNNLASIQTTGDLEVKFILEQPDKEFDQKLSDVPILSERYYQSMNSRGFGGFLDLSPLGYGPFSFEFEDDNSIGLISHPNYVFGRPFLNRVLFRFFDDEQSLLNAFIQGEVDLVELNERATAQRLHQILGNSVKIFPTPRPEKKLYYILLNTRSSPFDNAYIRRAIKLAVNPEEIVYRLTRQGGEVAYGLLDRNNPYFYRELLGESYRPDQSILILRRTGWQIDPSSGLQKRDGRDLSLDLVYEQGSLLEESIARLVKIQLAELGINLQPVPVNYSEKQEKFRKNDFTAMIMSYSYYEEYPYEAVKQFYYNYLKKRSPVTNYVNKTIEQMFLKADKDEEFKKRFMRRYQIFIHQDSPIIPLYFDNDIIYAVHARFRNIRMPFSSGKFYFYRLNPFENWFVPKVLQKYPDW
ncbi:MAG: hypothetical protein Kow0037_12400 [Calditrichia bacterium]